MSSRVVTTPLSLYLTLSGTKTHQLDTFFWTLNSLPTQFSFPLGSFRSITRSISFLKVPSDDRFCVRFSERRVNASWKLFSPVSSFQLDLKLKTKEGGDTSGYTTNGEWALIGTVTHTRLLRRTTYYVSQPTFSFISNSGCPL